MPPEVVLDLSQEVDQLAELQELDPQHLEELLERAEVRVGGARPQPRGEAHASLDTPAPVLVGKEGEVDLAVVYGVGALVWGHVGGHGPQDQVEGAGAEVLGEDLLDVVGGRAQAQHPERHPVPRGEDLEGGFRSGEGPVHALLQGDGGGRWRERHVRECLVLGAALGRVVEPDGTFRAPLPVQPVLASRPLEAQGVVDELAHLGVQVSDYFPLAREAGALVREEDGDVQVPKDPMEVLQELRAQVCRVGVELGGVLRRHLLCDQVEWGLHDDDLDPQLLHEIPKIGPSELLELLVGVDLGEVQVFGDVRHGGAEREMIADLQLVMDRVHGLLRGWEAFGTRR